MFAFTCVFVYIKSKPRMRPLSVGRPPFHRTWNPADSVFCGMRPWSAGRSPCHTTQNLANSAFCGMRPWSVGRPSSQWGPARDAHHFSFCGSDPRPGPLTFCDTRPTWQRPVTRESALTLIGSGRLSCKALYMGPHKPPYIEPFKKVCIQQQIHWLSIDPCLDQFAEFI
jgi:hypothetical protein